MAATTAPATTKLEAGLDPRLRVAAYLSLGQAVLWAFLLFRWVSFGAIDWTPFMAEQTLADFTLVKNLPVVVYILYIALLVVDLAVGVGILREMSWARRLGIGRSAVVLVGGVLYYIIGRDFFGAIFAVSLAGMLLVLLFRQKAWSLAYPAAFYLLIFFVIPNLIVFVVSLGERSRLGTVTYPSITLENLHFYFNDYLRFFSTVGGEYIYLRIFFRSLVIAILNTVICLLFGYPFAYWIARQPVQYRNILIFLVMIPFWTNFLVRTYAWMLILRDSGLINSFWTITLHQQAVMLADNSQFFSWLAGITADKLPLLFNTPAVMLGLFYGYLPFMILPLYASLDKVDWSLMEAAADLGANRWKSISRVLIPLTAPGIAAGSIIVFIPTLGAYVTPDLMGGAKVSLVGNLLQQQFMTVRDWPFGSAIGFILMAIMLIAIVIYFRVSEE
ncbi:MAG: ABC transporter permease [Candidatus Promineifilaceae bacterium]